MISRNTNCFFITLFPAANTSLCDIWILIFKRRPSFCFKDLSSEAGLVCWGPLELLSVVYFVTDSYRKGREHFLIFQIDRKWNWELITTALQSKVDNLVQFALHTVPTSALLTI